ncbi:hypothetical protein AALP_AA4G140400 [Arabis alpina]|uniref:Uncharacterized protein n=1 Tax=Arabis alpina TaxID=50452 RepID=A0A087H367_ARAAL|nr:hypothetical protein AALP_AA4G140400 [Arabis alpina]
MLLSHVRLGSHDAGTYNKNLKEWPQRGGATESLRFEIELKLAANAGNSGHKDFDEVYGVPERSVLILFQMPGYILTDKSASELVNEIVRDASKIQQKELNLQKLLCQNQHIGVPAHSISFQVNPGKILVPAAADQILSMLFDGVEFCFSLTLLNLGRICLVAGKPAVRYQETQPQKCIMLLMLIAHSCFPLKAFFHARILSEAIYGTHQIQQRCHND